MKGFSPVWVFLYVFKCWACVKALLHMSHVKGFSPVWILRCIFKFWAWLKARLHTLQVKGFFPVWVLMCTFKVWPSLKGLLHMSHVKAFSPVWVFLCVFKFWAVVKALLHMSHVKGFSPVWIIMCTFKVWPLLKAWLHISQLKGFSPVWFLMWVLMCTFKVWPLLKAWLHTSQVKSFSPVLLFICTSTWSARVKALPCSSQLWGLCSVSNFTTTPFSTSEFFSNVTCSVFWPKQYLFLILPYISVSVFFSVPPPLFEYVQVFLPYNTKPYILHANCTSFLLFTDSDIREWLLQYFIMCHYLIVYYVKDRHLQAGNSITKKRNYSVYTFIQSGINAKSKFD